MAYTYILRCSDDSYYTGSTKNLEQRLWQHQNGQGANYTKVRLPVKLIYSEYYERVDESFAREKQIQKWSRKKKEALINGDMDTLRCLSSSNGRCLSKSHFDKLSDHTSDELSDQVSDKVKNKSSNNRCLHFDGAQQPSLSNDRSLHFDGAQQPSLSNGRCLSLSKAEL